MTDSKGDRLVRMGLRHLPEAAASVVGALLSGTGTICAVSMVGAKMVSKEFAEWTIRQLSARQEARVAEALVHAALAFDENARAGMQLRPDLVDPESRATDVVQEIFEAATTVARDAFERRKVGFLGRAMANFAFAIDLSPA